MGEKKAPDPWLGTKGPSCGPASSLAIPPPVPAGASSCPLAVSQGSQVTSEFCVFGHAIPSTLEYHPPFLSPVANSSRPSRPNPNSTFSVNLFWDPPTKVSLCFSHVTRFCPSCTIMRRSSYVCPSHETVCSLYFLD